MSASLIFFKKLKKKKKTEKRKFPGQKSPRADNIPRPESF